MKTFETHNLRSTQATKLDAIIGHFDPWIAGIVLALASLGVVMVASSSLAIGEMMDVGEFYFLIRHLIFLVAGIVLVTVLMRVELKQIEKHHDLLLLASVALLAAVFLPFVGVTVNGARRWLNLGISNFQAVEAVKLLFIVWMASYLVRYRDELPSDWRTLLKPLGVIILLVALLLMQPDFGSAALLVAIGGCLIFLGGASIKRLAMLGIPALGVMALIAVLEPYRMARLINFRDPWQDPFAGGYQLVQALIAIGRGGWTGVGLGDSVQKLQAFPEVHTDFIFSVLAEEFGFVGVLAVFALYAGLTWRTFDIGTRCITMRRHFAGLLAYGIGLWIAIQTLVSIGVNLGMLPTKGLTLPLISSGGSSLLMTCAAIGVLLRISYELDRAERQVARARADADAVTAALAAEESMIESIDPPQLMPKKSSIGKQRVEPRWGATV